MIDTVALLFGKEIEDEPGQTVLLRSRPILGQCAHRAAEPYRVIVGLHRRDDLEHTGAGAAPLPVPPHHKGPEESRFHPPRPLGPEHHHVLLLEPARQLPGQPHRIGVPRRGLEPVAHRTKWEIPQGGPALTHEPAGHRTGRGGPSGSRASPKRYRAHRPPAEVAHPRLPAIQGGVETEHPGFEDIGAPGRGIGPEVRPAHGAPLGGDRTSEGGEKGEELGRGPPDRRRHLGSGGQALHGLRGAESFPGTPSVDPGRRGGGQRVQIRGGGRALTAGGFRRQVSKGAANPRPSRLGQGKGEPQIGHLRPPPLPLLPDQEVSGSDVAVNVAVAVKVVEPAERLGQSRPHGGLTPDFPDPGRLQGGHVFHEVSHGVSVTKQIAGFDEARMAQPGQQPVLQEQRLVGFGPAPHLESGDAAGPAVPHAEEPAFRPFGQRDPIGEAAAEVPFVLCIQAHGSAVGRCPIDLPPASLDTPRVPFPEGPSR